MAFATAREARVRACRGRPWRASGFVAWTELRELRQRRSGHRESESKSSNASKTHPDLRGRHRQREKSLTKALSHRQDSATIAHAHTARSRSHILWHGPRHLLLSPLSSYTTHIMAPPPPLYLFLIIRADAQRDWRPTRRAVLNPCRALYAGPMTALEGHLLHTLHADDATDARLELCGHASKQKVTQSCEQ